MKATIRWIDGVSFVAESGSGHGIVIDGDPQHGGRNLGIRPMEAVLMGLGACTSFDVVTILKKSRQNVRDCILELDAERADGVPRVFTKIHMHYRVLGRNLRRSAVERAISLSVEKYCSATAMLRPTVKIDHTFSMQEVDD